MNIGIDHGYYAIKTRNCSFPAGITPFGDREPYTRQNVLTFGGCFFVCGSGRQPIQRDKTANDNYYLLTLAAIAQEIRFRGVRRTGVDRAFKFFLRSKCRPIPSGRECWDRRENSLCGNTGTRPSRTGSSRMCGDTLHKAWTSDPVRPHT